MKREIDRWNGAASAVMQSVHWTVMVKKAELQGAALELPVSIHSCSHLWSEESTSDHRVAGRSIRKRVRCSVTREKLGQAPLLLRVERSQLRWMAPGCLT